MRLSRIFAFVCFSLLLVGANVRAQNLIVNGNFEAGLANWSVWSAPPGFWDGTWLQSNDCDIWVPTNGCPYQGAVSHAQKKGSGAGNAHGGIYQTLGVVPGRTYHVSGFWSGGATGNIDGNNDSWWEVVVFDGVVGDAIIDAGIRGPQDKLIAKKETINLAHNGVFQFQWEPFNGSFVAQSNSVTFALKTGSFFTLDAAGYHDVVSVTAAPVATPVPATDRWTLWVLILLVAVTYVALRGRRSAEG